MIVALPWQATVEVTESFGIGVEDRNRTVYQKKKKEKLAPIYTYPTGFMMSLE